MIPDSYPGERRQKRLRAAALLLILAMLSLAAWAWWIPEGTFDPWIGRIRAYLPVGHRR